MSPSAVAAAAVAAGGGGGIPSPPDEIGAAKGETTPTSFLEKRTTPTSAPHRRREVGCNLRKQPSKEERRGRRGERGKTTTALRDEGRFGCFYDDDG